MELTHQVQNDLKTAMKAGDKLKVSTLRMLISALKYAQIEAQGALTSTQESKVVLGEIKKRKEAIEAYGDASPERVEQEQAELVVLETYAPEGISDEKIEAVVKEVYGENPGMNMGQVMGAVMKRFKDEDLLVDGGKVREVVGKVIGS